MAKILIADDEELIRKLISDCLTKNGHTVLEAQDGEEAIKIFESEEDVDLAMLDIMMPELDGWQVCRKIRETSGIPVMLVSARSQDFDQIMGFESGADDYVTKPFSLAVLSRRVESLLQRGAVQIPKKDFVDDEDIEIENLLLKKNAHEVYIDGEIIELTLKEFKILYKLCKSPGRVYSRNKLLDEIWGIDYDGDIRTVDSHVARLRTKLGEWGNKNIITVYGTGYKLKKYN
ncbi:MAG: response regulator transcription factor [Ruminococcaceae bacterium]|nr:response regulator transcription factor [Oscillospiraceae bacterium]